MQALLESGINVSGKMYGKPRTDIDEHGNIIPSQLAAAVQRMEVIADAGEALDRAAGNLSDAASQLQAASGGKVIRIPEVRIGPAGTDR